MDRETAVNKPRTIVVETKPAPAPTFTRRERSPVRAESPPAPRGSWRKDLEKYEQVSLH